MIISRSRKPAKGLRQPWLARYNMVLAYARQFLHTFDTFLPICQFIDVDECKGNHSCHESLNCTNTFGSHVCDCQAEYNGNGQNCTGEFKVYNNSSYVGRMLNSVIGKFH